MKEPKEENFRRQVAIFTVAGLLLLNIALFLAWHLEYPGLYYLFLAPFFITGLIFYILLKKERDFQQKNKIDREELEANYSLLQEKQAKNEFENKGWQKRILKYSMLREITEGFSSSLNQEEISNLVTVIALYLIGRGETAFLWFVEGEELILKATSQVGEALDSQGPLRIKSRDWDIFDRWVLKHRSNLIVTDVEKDFRFSTSGDSKGERKIRSLISSPLLWGGEVKGFLKLEAFSPNEYGASDLRLLDIVAGLASLALENAELYQKTREMAIRDNLTELYTHKYFLEQLEEELERALTLDYPLSLVMLDIDHFKDYNDRFGHIAGDIVLRHLAKILREETAPGNLIARYGGEEFSLLLPQTDKEGAHRLAVRINKEVTEHIIILRRIETRITVSLGVATFPLDARIGTDLIKKADEALYQAKRKGRNQVCILPCPQNNS